MNLRARRGLGRGRQPAARAQLVLPLLPGARGRQPSQSAALAAAHWGHIQQCSSKSPNSCNCLRYHLAPAPSPALPPSVALPLALALAGGMPTPQWHKGYCSYQDRLPERKCMPSAQCRCAAGGSVCTPCGQLHRACAAVHAAPRPGEGAAGGAGRAMRAAASCDPTLCCARSTAARRRRCWRRTAGRSCAISWAATARRRRCGGCQRGRPGPRLPLVRVGRQCLFRGAECRPQRVRRLRTEAGRQRFSHLPCVQHHAEAGQVASCVASCQFG
jgi:hypothetical protein